MHQQRRCSIALFFDTPSHAFFNSLRKRTKVSGKWNSDQFKKYLNFNLVKLILRTICTTLYHFTSTLCLVFRTPHTMGLTSKYLLNQTIFSHTSALIVFVEKKGWCIKKKYGFVKRAKITLRSRKRLDRSGGRSKTSPPWNRANCVWNTFSDNVYFSWDTCVDRIKADTLCALISHFFYVVVKMEIDFKVSTLENIFATCSPTPSTIKRRLITVKFS